MSIAPPAPMRLAAFLDWEAQQELKFEFDGWQPVAMVGGTRGHALLQSNLAIFIGGRLLSTSCRFYGSDFKIEVAGSIRYPDGFVACSPGTLRDTVAADPMVIFEVLSPSTAGTDRITKDHEYAATPSVRRYVMLEQDRIAATMFARSGSNWVGQLLLDDATLDLPEIGLSLPLAELYRGIDFDEIDRETA